MQQEIQSLREEVQFGSFSCYMSSFEKKHRLAAHVMKKFLYAFWLQVGLALTLKWYLFFSECFSRVDTLMIRLGETPPARCQPSRMPTLSEKQTGNVLMLRLRATQTFEA